MYFHLEEKMFDQFCLEAAEALDLFIGPNLLIILRIVRDTDVLTSEKKALIITRGRDTSSAYGQEKNSHIKIICPLTLHPVKQVQSTLFP